MKVKEETEKVGLKFNIQKRWWHPVPSLHGKQMRKQWKQCQTLFSWAPKSLHMVTAAMKLKDAFSLEEKQWQPRQQIKKQRHYFADKDPYSQSYDFSSSRVWMWELDQKEDWAPKNWCFQTVVLEKTLESPLDSREIKSVNPKRNQPWIFIGRTGAEAEAEAPVLWLPYLKSWLIGKDNAGKDWGQEEKGRTEDKMVRWHHCLNGHEFEQIQEEGGELACCISWGRKESNTT